MLTTDRIEEIADYCKVDENDRQLPGFILAAGGYLATAGVTEPPEGTTRAELYLQCLKYITLDLYDRRDGSTDGTVGENPTFRRMLNQLKQSAPALTVSAGDGTEVT